MADGEIVQALTSFTATNGQGAPVHVFMGKLYRKSDPVVMANGHLFGPPDVMSTETAERVPRQMPRPAEAAIAPPSGATRAPVTAAGAKVKAAGGVAAPPKARPVGEV